MIGGVLIERTIKEVLPAVKQATRRASHSDGPEGERAGQSPRPLGMIGPHP
jgi:hypothetical protein